MHKFLSVVVSTCCRKICVLFCATTIALPPPAFGMLRSKPVIVHCEHEFDASVAYGRGRVFCSEDGENLITQSQAPTDTSLQASLIYRGDTQPIRESYEGEDLRVRIADPKRWPYSVHGQMESRSALGKSFSGSGTLVGPQHFLTAGHCVHDKRMGGWARSLTIHPALNDHTAPFGAIRGMRAYVYKEWIERENPDFDIALVVLEEAIGHATGWAGMIASEEGTLRNQQVHVTGYPGEDAKRNQLWTMEDQLEWIDNETFAYRMQTSGGQSGGGIWVKQLTSPVVLGVHTSAYGGKNLGVRLSKQKLRDIVGWMEQTGKIAAPQVVVSSALSPSSSSSSSSSAQQLDKDALLEQAQSGDRRSLSDLLFLAEEDGDSWAEYNLGKIYEDGKAVKQDTQKALRLYKMAAAQNHPRARIACERLEDEAASLNQGRNGTSSSSSSLQPPATPVTTKPTPPPPLAASSSSNKPTSASSSGSSSVPPPAAAAAAASSSTAVTKVSRPLSDDIQIPEIARGYEEVYRRFLGGKLIYRPGEDGDDTGMVTLKFSDLANPLEGTFDLSRCGDTGQYLSISTGYRKGKILANENKWEIWFTPWFVADKAVAQVPQNHYLRTVTTPDKWDGARAPVGIFWTRGGWDDLKYVDYLTTQNMDQLCTENLYEKWTASAAGVCGGSDGAYGWAALIAVSMSF